MAITTISTSNELRKALWEKKLYDRMIADSFFSRFSSDKMNSLVWIKEDLMKEQGDKITFGLTSTDPESEEGVSGSDTLENNEVALETGNFKVELEVYRQAVRDNIITRKRACFDVSAEEEEWLRKWGVAKLDRLHFSAAYSSPTNVCYMNSTAFTVGSSAATALAAVDATNGKLTPALIAKTRVIAKTGNGGSAYRMDPIVVDGMELYILVVPEDVMYDLSQNSAMQQAQRDALERGKKNPIFRAGDLLYNGVLITASSRCNSTLGGAGGIIPVAECLFMGKSAICRADGKKFSLISKDFDYVFQKGLAAMLYTGIEKAQFASKDYSLIDLVVARTAISNS